jgi:outer membrane protein
MSMISKKSILILSLASGLTLPFGVHAQSILKSYIDSAFNNNLALKQKNISLEKSLLALESAKSLYWPTLNIQGGYQTGEGGRSIALPVGDLLNPVYASLNKLTASNAFPAIENEETYFLPQNFYDVKVATSIPLLNTDLKYNKNIHTRQASMQKTDLLLYKRELVVQVKTAYYNYLSALEAVGIFKQALELAEAGKRTNEKLLASGKGLAAYILRSESEISQLKAQQNEAENQVEAAALHFNFLLNRPKNTPITVDTAYLKSTVSAAFTNQWTSRREELELIKEKISINKDLLSMHEKFSTPKINGFLQLGSQSSAWKFNAQSAYYITGLQVDMPLFQGKRNIRKIEQTKLDIRSANTQYEETEALLQMSQSIAWNNLESARTNQLASLKQLEAASTYQRLIEKGFREGVNTFLETLDARNQVTQAQLLVNINNFKVRSAEAKLEREQATFPLENN